VKVLNKIKGAFNLTDKDIKIEESVTAKKSNESKKDSELKCPKCGKQIKAEFKICPYCAARLKE